MAPPSRPTLILGTRPVDINCPECHDDVRTIIIYRPPDPTICSTITAVIFCCLCWPCICIPICCHVCLTGVHSCPNCNAEIGTSDGTQISRPNRRPSLSRGRSNL